jgi:hypothetical protein
LKSFNDRDECAAAFQKKYFVLLDYAANCTSHEERFCNMTKSDYVSAIRIRFVETGVQNQFAIMEQLGQLVRGYSAQQKG